MIEYALIASIIAVALIVSLQGARDGLITTWTNITAALAPAAK
jgi:Flp pilus assembly pilin Flp